MEKEELITKTRKEKTTKMEVGIERNARIEATQAGDYWICVDKEKLASWQREGILGGHFFLWVLLMFLVVNLRRILLADVIRWIVYEGAWIGLPLPRKPSISLCQIMIAHLIGSLIFGWWSHGREHFDLLDELCAHWSTHRANRLVGNVWYWDATRSNCQEDGWHLYSRVSINSSQSKKLR